MPPNAVHRTAAIFGLLRHRELRAIWFAEWISDVGSFVTFIALAVYMQELTGSALAVGVALAIRSVPWFTIGPFAGALADRLDRRSLMVASDLARALLVGALPFTRAPWQAYLLALLAAMFSPVFRPARSALLPQIAPEGRLVPALAVMETTHQVLHTIGPAIGGLVVLLVGARKAFFVDAASFLLSAAFILRVRSRGRPLRERVSPLEDLARGVRAVLATPAARAYTLLETALRLGYGGVLALLVEYVRVELGRPGGQYGLVLSVAGLGTVAASLAIAARDDRHARTPWAWASVAGLGAFVLASVEPPFIGLLPIALAAGISDAGVGIPMAATLAETLGDDLRGRAYGIANGLGELAAATGSVAFAWLGDPGRLGPGNGIALAALVGTMLGAAVLASGAGSAITRTERTRLAGIEPR